jgi:ABC-type thiamin/hydroxymethylpyrimidine transport system permease subunit
MIAILSALGGAFSILLGNFLTSIPLLPFGSAQFFSGLHVFWIALASVMVNKKGVGTLTGVLKGLVESALVSFHGFIALPISALEGAVLDLCLMIFGRDKTARALNTILSIWCMLFCSLPTLPFLLLFHSHRCRRY